jgi:hypothetical protein
MAVPPVCLHPVRSREGTLRRLNIAQLITGDRRRPNKRTAFGFGFPVAAAARSMPTRSARAMGRPPQKRAVATRPAARG